MQLSRKWERVGLLSAEGGGSVPIRRGEIRTGPALDITRPRSEISSLILEVSSGLSLGGKIG
jgi:hypothetical protein